MKSPRPFASPKYHSPRGPSNSILLSPRESFSSPNAPANFSNINLPGPKSPGQLMIPPPIGSIGLLGTGVSGSPTGVIAQNVRRNSDTILGNIGSNSPGKFRKSEWDRDTKPRFVPPKDPEQLKLERERERMEISILRRQRLDTGLVGGHSSTNGNAVATRSRSVSLSSQNRKLSPQPGNTGPGNFGNFSFSTGLSGYNNSISAQNSPLKSPRGTGLSNWFNNSSSNSSNEGDSCTPRAATGFQRLNTNADQYYCQS